MARALLALVMLLLAPGALAQGAPEPHLPGAHTASVGNATVSFWVGPSATVVDETLALGEEGSLWFWLDGSETALVAYLNVTPSTATLAIPNGSVVLTAAANATRAPVNVSFAPTIADAGVVNQSYAFSGEVYREANGTLELVGPISGAGAFTMDVGALVPVPPPAEPGGIPRSWLIAGIAVLVVGGGAGAILARQRAVKRRMNEGPRRSQVMREMELEQKLEKAKAKDPEAAVVIQQEIRQAEQVREKRRELQILEAKRADAMKTLDLLKKRHEAGGLTKLQYDNMAAKKRADLERIEAEIAEMERGDSGAAA